MSVQYSSWSNIAGSYFERVLAQRFEREIKELQRRSALSVTARTKGFFRVNGIVGKWKFQVKWRPEIIATKVVK